MANSELSVLKAVFQWIICLITQETETGNKEHRGVDSDQNTELKGILD